MNFNNFFQELKRRNVFRVATAYAISGWLVIQVSDTVLPRIGVGETAINFIVTLVLIGFPMAILIAWFFEVTPDGLKKTEEVEEEDSIGVETGRKINRIAIISLSLVITLLITERIFFASTPVFVDEFANIELASVAVIPFADMSPNGDQEYFSDGLSEELLNVLAKEVDLRVAGSISSFKFKGQTDDFTTIGQQLQVRHVLEGSVRKAGNTLRITAKLIDARSGVNVWSETYDREYTAENVFQIQDEISLQVLNELKVRLLDDESNISSDPTLLTEDIEAYEAYLKGLDLIRNRDPEEMKRGIEEFKRAVQFDPSFAEALAQLSTTYARLYQYGNIEKEKALQFIRSYADQAIFINPELPRAYLGLNDYYEILDDSANALNAIQRANEIKPNDPEILNALAVTMNSFGIEGRELVQERAYELDPLSPVYAINFAIDKKNDGEYEVALTVIDKIIEANPDFVISYFQKISILRREPFGELDKAFIAAYDGYKANSNSLPFLTILRDATHDFDFDSLRFAINKDIIESFADNPDVNVDAIERQMKIILAGGFFENREYQKALEYYLEHDLFRPGYDPYEAKLIQTMQRLDYIEDEEYEQAFEMFKVEMPIYFSDTLTVHPVLPYSTLEVKYVFEQVGREDLAANLEGLYNNGSKPLRELEKELDIPTAEFSELFNLFPQYAYEGNIPMMYAIIDEIYIKRNYKLYDWIELFEDNEMKQYLTDDSLAALIEFIRVDQQRMRDNVINFLKEQDNYNPAWYETE